jgi:uncharacterized protein YbjT (DUF2867 family)
VARGDRVRGLIRNPAHADDLRSDGSEPVVCDLESAADEEVAVAIAGADSALFAAGAGAGSGAERKLTIDRDGAIKLLRACTQAGVPRYVVISSIGAESSPDGDDVWSVYLRAKAEADAAVRASGRDWTIVRPVFMNDEPGTGRVQIRTDPIDGEVPRDDVAATLAAVLHEPRTVHTILYVAAGDATIEQALESALGD